MSSMQEGKQMEVDTISSTSSLVTTPVDSTGNKECFKNGFVGNVNPIDRRSLINKAIKSGRENETVKKRRNFRDFAKPTQDYYKNANVHLAKELPMINVEKVSGNISSWECCKCLPISSTRLMNEDITNMDLLDVLTLPLLSRHEWTRLICDVRFVWNQRCACHYTNFTKDVLSHSRVLKAIREEIETDKLDGAKNNEDARNKFYELKAKGNVEMMSASFSLSLIRLTGWLLYKIFKFLLSSIVIHKGQMYVIQQLCKKSDPVVFLPTHRSHLDYILLSFILFNFNTRLPYVAAGDNLTLPFFGMLMRGLGGFFIRRKMDESKERRDRIYRAVLHTYVEEILRRGELLEFYVEGGRSRSGKILQPRTGLLSIVVDAYLRGVVPDVNIVPVSICYEKLPEVNFVEEQLGLKKKSETFWNALKGVYKSFFSFYGSVRIDFSQPFSLKEFVDASLSSSTNQNEGLSRTSSESFISCRGDEKTTRGLVHKLATHVAYDQTRMHSVSSIHLLSWVLSVVHRRGVKMKDLIKSFDFWRGEVIGRNHNLGFVGSSNDVVRYALDLLGRHLVEVIVNSDGEEYVSPSTKLPNIIELSYYSNTVNMIFSMESVIANSIYSACKLKSRQWISVGQTVRFAEDEVIEESMKLAQLLGHEFIFYPPCQSLELAAYSAFHLLINSFIVCRPEDLEPYTEDESSNIRTHGTSDDEDCREPETFMLNTENSAAFLHLKDVLGPTLETYHVASTFLTRLLPHDMIESEFMETIHSYLKDRAYNCTADYDECVCLETLRNCLKGFEECHVVGTYDSCDVRLIGLLGDFHSTDVLDQFISRLASYRN